MTSTTAPPAAELHPIRSVGCDCPASHLGGPRCGSRAVYLYGGERVATEAVRWYAEIELGWIRDNSSDRLVCDACGEACDGGAAALSRAVLVAADARWPGGGRVLDAAPSAIEEYFLPELLRALVTGDDATDGAAP